MFTGIIQSLGKIQSIIKETNVYVINTNLDLKGCKFGSSICCDGVCLTMIKITNNYNDFQFEVNVGEETLQRTNLLKWSKNSKINLEKSLKLGDELSGHFVYGHVDITLPISNITKLTNSWEFIFSLLPLKKESKLKKLIVTKGSIAINGISLTIAEVYKDSFSVSIIPHTFNNTNLSFLKELDLVNIEFDSLARYVSKYYEN